MRDDLRRRADALSEAREIRIVGPDTDLRVGVEGRRWQPADGHLQHARRRGLHEPARDADRGRDPLHASPRSSAAARSRTSGSASRGARSSAPRRRAACEYLEALLDVDEGARRLGEVAFGLNYEIDRFTNNTLFDEKIGGTMHVALGSSFEELGGENDSALHWDLVCDLRAEGEVYADGELIWKAGHFLEQPQPARV